MIADCRLPIVEPGAGVSPRRWCLQSCFNDGTGFAKAVFVRGGEGVSVVTTIADVWLLNAFFGFLFRKLQLAFPHQLAGQLNQFSVGGVPVPAFKSVFACVFSWAAEVIGFKAAGVSVKRELKVARKWRGVAFLDELFDLFLCHLFSFCCGWRNYQPATILPNAVFSNSHFQLFTIHGTRMNIERKKIVDTIFGGSWNWS